MRNMGIEGIVTGLSGAVPTGVAGNVKLGAAILRHPDGTMTVLKDLVLRPGLDLALRQACEDAAPVRIWLRAADPSRSGAAYGLVSGGATLYASPRLGRCFLAGAALSGAMTALLVATPALAAMAPFTAFLCAWCLAYAWFWRVPSRRAFLAAAAPPPAARGQGPTTADPRDRVALPDARTA